MKETIPVGALYFGVSLCLEAREVGGDCERVDDKSTGEVGVGGLSELRSCSPIPGAGCA